MFSYKGFLDFIDLIAENLYDRLGVTDTFIVFFRHGYNVNALDDDYVIVSWAGDHLIFDNDFNEGQDIYIFDNAISIIELRRLLNTRISDLYSGGVKDDQKT